MTFRKISIAFLLSVLSASFADAKPSSKYEPTRQLTAEQSALVERAIGREKVLIKDIQQRTPLVETYIQEIRPDAKLYQVPVADDYMLSRVDFGKGFFDRTFELKAKSPSDLLKGSVDAITRLSRALGLGKAFGYDPLGFTEMMFLDPSNFDQRHYVFSYVRREFIGSVRTWVYDVHPKVKGTGRFYGRVWVEDEDANIVRFNGTYTTSTDTNSRKIFMHCDSWRMNVPPGIWLPVAIYVEETHLRDNQKAVGLKAQTHFWGYSLKLPTRDSENVTVKVDEADDKSDDSQDVSPLQASREWVNQAENNVIDRLVAAGLVAPLTPDGYESKVLEQIVTNLSVPSNLALTSPVHCRVILTDTVEATTVGNTILVSRGLLDAMPNEESIASVVALELAHIAMGHHIDTRYAFNDRLLFPDESTFHRIEMNHSDHDNEAAAAKGMEYLQASMYKEHLPGAGLFWVQLADRGKALSHLNTPRLGDSLLRSDGTPWMTGLARSSTKLNWDDLGQIAALPLGSWLKIDPWDDRVHMVTAKRFAPMNPRDKMPLEVTPVYYNLQRFSAPSPTPAKVALQGWTELSADSAR